MRPRVSVVIPTYNRAADLQRALDSVRAQTFGAWEVLVVDNHSSDDTDAVVRACMDPRIRLLKIHNQGIIAASRNLGIREAQGEFVAFLDSDDWWTPAKLEASVAMLDRGADVVYHDLFLADGRGTMSRRRLARTRALREPAARDLIAHGNALNNSSVLVRRACLTEIGGLSEESELVAIEDYDAWIRLAHRAAKFVRLDQTLGYYWVGGGNTSNAKRQLSTTAAIRVRHAADFAAADAELGFNWIGLAQGQAFLKLGHHRDARRSLAPYLWNKAPLRWKAKALAWVLLSLVREVLHGSARRSEADGGAP